MELWGESCWEWGPEPVKFWCVVQDFGAEFSLQADLISVGTQRFFLRTLACSDGTIWLRLDCKIFPYFANRWHKTWAPYWGLTRDCSHRQRGGGYPTCAEGVLWSGGHLRRQGGKTLLHPSTFKSRSVYWREVREESTAKETCRYV